MTTLKVPDQPMERVGNPMKRNQRILALMALLLAIPPVFAELQWVTGGVPENTANAGASTLVKDTPEEMGGTWSTSGGDSNGPILCHLTTCTKILNNYPADSVNYFFLNVHHEICYYAYFLMKPTTRLHTSVVEWFSPSGNRIARQEQEHRVGFTDKILTIGGENYQWFLTTSVLGMSQPNNEAHQVGLPRDVGLYTVRLQVDGQPAGITFFYVREPDKNIQAMPTVTNSNSTAHAGFKSGMSNLAPLLMSTPVSTAPLAPLSTKSKETKNP
jgi:hypothetical protein